MFAVAIEVKNLWVSIENRKIYSEISQGWELVQGVDEKYTTELLNDLNYVSWTIKSLYPSEKLVFRYLVKIIAETNVVFS